MTAGNIADIANTARKAGITTLLELSIAAELLRRGECTLVSLTHTLGVPLEAIALASAQMQIAGVGKCVVCREAVGYSIARLSPAAEKAFGEILKERSAA